MKARDVDALLTTGAVLFVGICLAQLLAPVDRRPAMHQPIPPGDDRDPGDESDRPPYAVGVECPVCYSERVSTPNAQGVAWCRVCDAARQIIPLDLAA